MDWQPFISYLLSGLILWGVAFIARELRHANEWRHRVDARLARIESHLELNGP